MSSEDGIVHEYCETQREFLDIIEKSLECEECEYPDFCCRKHTEIFKEFADRIY
jgi:hypothetical protein